MAIQPTRLETLQENTKSDPTLVALQELIKTGWPESMQDLTDSLHPYWCFRDELALMDGLVLKGSRVIIPIELQEDTLQRLHEGHHGQPAMLRRARRTVYWPGIQDDITRITQQCDECQKHAKKQSKPPERQVSTTRPMEVLGIDLMDFEGEDYVVAVDFFSGYIFYDRLASKTSKDTIDALNNIFQKLWPPERILSDNGPCFKSGEFKKFCEKLEIKHTTSSPYYHQSNGRVERAIQTVRRMKRKNHKDIEMTLALLAYHDTPISDNLPSPAELLFNRRTNTRLAPAPQPSYLDDEQKHKLAQKRSSHLKKGKVTEDYIPNQPIWYTEDGTTEWKQGHIESNDVHPDSYWIVNSNNRRFRRNKHDLKPRFPQALERRPQPQPPDVDMEWNPQQAEPPVHMNIQDVPPMHIEPPLQADPPPAREPIIVPHVPKTPTHRKVRTPAKPAIPIPVQAADPPQSKRSGRMIKPNQDPNFIYPKSK